MTRNQPIQIAAPLQDLNAENNFKDYSENNHEDKT